MLRKARVVEEVAIVEGMLVKETISVKLIELLAVALADENGVDKTEMDNEALDEEMSVDDAVELAIGVPEDEVTEDDIEEDWDDETGWKTNFDDVAVDDKINVD